MNTKHSSALLNLNANSKRLPPHTQSPGTTLAYHSWVVVVDTDLEQGRKIKKFQHFFPILKDNYILSEGRPIVHRNTFSEILLCRFLCSCYVESFSQPFLISGLQDHSEANREKSWSVIFRADCPAANHISTPPAFQCKWTKHTGLDTHIWDGSLTKQCESAA